MFKSSPYQQAIFDALSRPGPDIQVSAVAGSGKTTTLVEALKRLPARSLIDTLFCAFNKEIVNELVRRVPREVTVKTTHSIGFTTLASHFNTQTMARWNPRVDDRKYRNLTAHFWATNYRRPHEPEHEVEKEMFRLIHFCRVTLTDPDDQEAVIKMAVEREIELPEDNELERMLMALPQILHWGTSTERPLRLDDQSYSPVNYVDYDDMLWLPWYLKLRPRRYGLVAVDECQDLNAAQLELVMNCRRDGGRMLFVGDRRQCQPPGTMVRLASGEDVPIESLKVGDLIWSYDRRSASLIREARIEAVGTRDYQGDLYSIRVGEKVSLCTDSHKWLVRWTTSVDRYLWCTYIMRQGSRYRIGRSRIFHPNKSGYGVFGLRARARCERADAAWILRVYETEEESVIDEQVLSMRYSLPQTRFYVDPKYGVMTQAAVDAVFKELEPVLEDRARACLESFGRRLDYPFLTLGSSTYGEGRKTVFETQACNLIAGCMAVVEAPSSWPTSYESRAGVYSTIEEVSSLPYKGKVYSLEVGRYHKYVSDGLLTCNSIYGFTGADHRSFENIAKRTGTIQLPLSVCYRCPKAVIELAKTIVPEIEATETAPQGVVEHIKEATFYEVVKRRDMVLCRVNAPMIKACFRLIAMGKPAKVRGRDIGAQLIKLIDTIEKMEGFKFDEFVAFAETYRRQRVAILAQKPGSEMQVESLHDRVDSVIAVYEAAVDGGSKRMGDLRAHIQGLFTDDDADYTIFSSIHRSKGLEEKTVYLIRPDKLPHPMAKSAAQREQEENLRYVAYTRAGLNLYIVQPAEK